MREGWTYKKLGEVASFSRGLTYSKGDVAIDSSKKVLRSNNIDLATHSLNFDDVACLKEEFVIPVEKMLQQNDIFICMSNGSTQHLGKVAFIDKKMDYAFGGFMGAVHPKVNDIFPKYAFYFCLSSEYRRLLASVLNGININNLKWSDLSKFPIPVPPLSEQQRVVNELDLLSSIIEKKKAQLKEYDQLAQSIFFDMFGNKHFTKVSLESVYNFIDYRGATPNKIENGVPLVTAKNVRQGYIDYTIKEYISEEEYNRRQSRGISHKGDILFTTEAPMGFAAIADLDRFSAGQRLITLQLNEQSSLFVNNIYALHCILSEPFQDELNRLSTGCTVKGIKASKLKKIEISLPSLSLQQSFASKIEAIERQKALIRQSITEAETLFNSRMDYYFN